MEAYRTRRGAERLCALRQTAANMFLEQGYEAVSLDTLIASVGGSRRNIYDYFGGKEGLFIEAVTECCAELAAPLERLDIHGSDPRDALVLFGRKTLETVVQPRTLALHRLMIAEGQRFPELSRSIWHAGHDSATLLLSRWFEDRQHDGQFRADMPAATLAAQYISLAVTTPQLRCLVGVGAPLRPAEISKIVDNAVTVFLDGALTRKD
ncbi:TetR/AcrR family transcriptional regulator [Terrihabitans sp. B22-R8]|uniref:TetR/AcrR family transcriptional regulator n=1 Tax=Terrihabitans sp. B22-R8 TaxID=3425128 RepID=UPI00403C45DF